MTPARLARTACLAAIALTAAAPLARAQRQTDLHLPNNGRINFTHQINDGAGYRWDIQYNGNIGNGTDNAYSGGLYCQINGSNVSSNGNGWKNAAGDEVEIGPYAWGNLKIHRRIKVYQDQGLARWLDIFHNPSAVDVNMQVRIYSYINYGVQATWTPDGDAQFGDKDWAVVHTTGNANNTPHLMHLVCDKRSKVRPTIQQQGNQFYVNYALHVPAGQTVVLCYFEAQDRNVASLRKRAREFRAYKVLRDLKPAVRKLIVNFSAVSGLLDVDLDRSTTNDALTLTNGDPIFGTILNKQFRMDATVGELTIPAGQVIGFVAAPGDTGKVRVVLADGQLICGRMPGQTLEYAIPSGGVLKIPFDRVRQGSYRISEDRPEEIRFQGPYVHLRTGDRLGFRGETLSLTLRTRHGTVPLAPEKLLHVKLDDSGSGVHRATFRNGSTLFGFLQPDRITATLRLGSKMDIERDMIRSVEFGMEGDENPALTVAELSNGDKLFGELTDARFTLRTDYGAVEVAPGTVRSMVFERDRVRVQLWDGSVLRGRLGQEELGFAVKPGPTLKIHTGQLKSVVRNQSLPPRAIRETVEKLIARLGSESYDDRQKATDELIKLGPKIVPLLQKQHKSTQDPEIRQRIRAVLDKLEPQAAGNTPGHSQPMHWWGGQRAIPVRCGG